MNRRPDVTYAGGPYDGDVMPEHWCETLAVQGWPDVRVLNEASEGVYRYTPDRRTMDWIPADAATPPS